MPDQARAHAICGFCRSTRSLVRLGRDPLALGHARSIRIVWDKKPKSEAPPKSIYAPNRSGAAACRGFRLISVASDERGCAVTTSSDGNDYAEHPGAQQGKAGRLWNIANRRINQKIGSLERDDPAALNYLVKGAIHICQQHIIATIIALITIGTDGHIGAHHRANNRIAASRIPAYLLDRLTPITTQNIFAG